MNIGFDMSVLNQPKSDLLKKMAIAVFANLLLGFAIAFNSCIGYGNDAVSVLYDGIHNKFALNLGFATNLVNLIIFLVVLIFGRKYINIGTLIYLIFLGSFVNLGISLYNSLNVPDVWYIKVPLSILSYLILFFGVALYIAIEIGVDQWTGLVLILTDKTPLKYLYLRDMVDISAFLLGNFLGGKSGWTTWIAMLFSGPVINGFTTFINKYVLKLFNFQK